MQYVGIQKMYFLWYALYMHKKYSYFIKFKRFLNCTTFCSFSNILVFILCFKTSFFFTINYLFYNTTDRHVGT